MRALRAPVLAMTAMMAAMPAAAAGPTFEQVLAAPDDVGLNVAYAKAEANEGHLLSAAAALERVLMLKPNAASARLFYAVVLYRLDDLQAANAQLALVDASQLPPLERKELEKYRRIVSSTRKSTTFNGELAAGIAYDSDALGALLIGTPLGGPRPSHKPGTGAVVSAALSGSTRLDDAYSLYAALAGYSRTDFSDSEAQIQYFGGEIGLKNTEQMTSWQVAGVVRHTLVFGNPLLTEYGGRASFDWRADTAVTLSASLESVWQDYHEPFYVPFSSFVHNADDGAYYRAQGGIAWRIDSHSRVDIAAGYESHPASYRPFGYTAPFANIDYRGLLGSGIYVDLFGNLRWARYDAVDIHFTSVRRNDTDYLVRAALGVPLSAFSADGATGDMLEDLTLEGSVNYASRARTAPFSDYGGFGAGLRLVWHFGDGR
jgi:hypothetical protein